MNLKTSVGLKWHKNGSPKNQKNILVWVNFVRSKPKFHRLELHQRPGHVNKTPMGVSKDTRWSFGKRYYVKRVSTTLTSGL